jgi:hypothetical protein
VQYNNVKYAEIVDYGTLDNACWGIVIHTDTRSYDTNRETSYKKLAESWLIEAINAIYLAKHQPLCVKHAMEVGYEFRANASYYAISKKAHNRDDDTQLMTGEMLESLAEAGSILAFYPVVKQNGRWVDNHGEAEAVVDAWKEGE